MELSGRRCMGHGSFEYNWSHMQRCTYTLTHVVVISSVLKYGSGSHKRTFTHSHIHTIHTHKTTHNTHKHKTHTHNIYACSKLHTFTENL